MRKASGFTLVEAVAVIVIGGILAALAFPYFVDSDAFERRGFYDQVISSLRYAQKAAIAQRRFVCVAFGANIVTLTYDPVPPSISHTVMTACPGGSALAGFNGQSSYTVSSDKTSFSSAPASFYFNALGSPSVASQQTVSIANVTSPIYIEAETGYVH